MKAVIKLPIVCGEKTCVSKSGKFCAYLRVSRFGTEWTCNIFREWELLKDTHGDGTGWLLRHRECIKATEE